MTDQVTRAEDLQPRISGDEANEQAAEAEESAPDSPEEQETHDEADEAIEDMDSEIHRQPDPDDVSDAAKARLLGTAPESRAFLTSLDERIEGQAVRSPDETHIA